MGREWLHWSGAGGGTTSRSTKRSRSGGERETPSGCMSAVLQLFDLNHFHFALHHQTTFKPDSFLPEEPIVLKGVEAPRNSLELEEAAPLSSTVVKEENLNIPMGIQIKTSGDARSSRTDDLSSEFSSSPGTKTPNLVARLMGLDLLPESSSPSSSSSIHSTSNPPLKSHLHPQLQSLRGRQISNRNFSDNDFSGTRSLPETPRISSARRSDVDHRLSLQINKENTNEEVEFSSYLTAKMGRKRELRVQEEENRSPGHYARQIVKQVRESVHRRVGVDITNTIKTRERRDEHLVLLKSKKLSATKNQISHSPKPSSPAFIDFQSQCVKVSSKPKSSQVPLREQKCNKIASNQRYGQRHKKPPQKSDVIRNKKEEPYVRSPPTNRANLSDKKCKKTPLSNDLLNLNVPTLHHSPPTRLPQKQVSVDALSSKRSTQLSSCSSHSYKQQGTLIMLTVQGDKCNGAATTTGGGAEFEYISRILKRTGIDNNSPVSFTKWYSPSHPLDPSIFHHLELFHPTAVGDPTLDHRCNRKLMFQLVDELLVEILKPYINLKPWVSSTAHDSEMYGSELIEKLCARIRRFPAADCRVLDDIDALIDEDMGRMEAFEEEGEGIVSEIERDIVETLVHETAMVVWEQRPYSVTV